MLIPRSQGRTVSKPTLQQHTPMTGLASIGKAVGDVMDARDQQKREAEAKQKQVALYQDTLAEKEAQAQLDDVLTQEGSEQVTLLKNNVANGTLTADAANESLKSWSDTRYKELEPTLPLHAQENLKKHWSHNIGTQTASFLPLQLRADAQKGTVLADRFGEIATRMDRQAGREYLEGNLSTLNLSEADKQSRLYGYESGRDQLDIDNRITVALEGKDIQSLQALRADLNSNKFGYLDGKQIQQNKDRVASRIEALNTQLKAEENKRVSEAGKYLNEYKSNVLTGRAQDSGYEANVGQLVAGTEHEAEFKFLQSQSLNFQKFAGKSTSEQLSLINAQKAKMKNSASANASEEEKILSTYEGMYREKLDTIKRNPNQAVAEAGLKVHSLGGGLLKANPAEFISGAIDNGSSQLALKDPNIKVKPISEEDLPEAKQAFDKLSVNEKLNFIGGLIQQSKGIQNGATLWGATLGQLGNGDQNYVAAGLAKMNGYRSTAGRPLATSIINGAQLLKNKQLIMPKEDDLRSKFNAYVGNTVSGTSANNMYNVFRAVYADTMDARSLQHKAKDEVPDADVLEFALASATGGVYEQSGSFSNYGGGQIKGWKVALPYGMSDSSFEARLQTGYEAISKSTGLSVSELESLRLRQSSKRSAQGEIQYDLLNERGNPLTVEGVVWRLRLSGVTK